MPSTKEKILEQSLLLFNQNGLKQTTLQTIADAIPISVGNLAYHYKNKNEIVAAHTVKLNARLQEALSHYRNFPGMIDFQLQLNHILETTAEYRYLFVNLGEVQRLFPETFTVIQTFAQKLVTQIESRLEYQQEKQALYPIPLTSIQHLAKTLSSQIVLAQSSILLFPDTQEFFVAFWELVYPHFTPQGEQEWRQHILPALVN
ncbi:MAG: TetR/AcrR family transcriptional regulator [Bacteroidota bacterium]